MIGLEEYVIYLAWLISWDLNDQGKPASFRPSTASFFYKRVGKTNIDDLFLLFFGIGILHRIFINTFERPTMFRLKTENAAIKS